MKKGISRVKKKRCQKVTKPHLTARGSYKVSLKLTRIFEKTIGAKISTTAY